MNISYVGGCWDANIGNSFIDFGSIQSLGNHRVMQYSEKSKSFFGKKSCFNSIFDFDCDLVVFSGMVMCPSFFRDQKWILDVIERNDIPILINGGGGCHYSESEVSETIRLLSQYN